MECAVSVGIVKTGFHLKAQCFDSEKQFVLFDELGMNSKILLNGFMTLEVKKRSYFCIFITVH